MDELAIILTDERATQWLQVLGIKSHEMKGLFTLMDDGDDEITFAEFLAGVMRLKGSSKHVDLATLLYENKKILKRLLIVRDSVDRLHEHLDSNWHRIRTKK